MAEREAIDWLRTQCGSFVFDVVGVYRRTGDLQWPLEIADEADLEYKLTNGGHVLSLPKEPAALANVLEVALADHLLVAAEGVDELDFERGTERGYPDLELSGPFLGGEHVAVDIKLARRARNRDRTQSRITLYTGNTYFKWPQLHWPGTFRPFDQYAAHLDIIGVYTLNEDLPSRVEDLELIVQPAWRIASHQRSSTTREYIGAVDRVDDLRDGNGEFDSADDFYRFWRAFEFKISRQVQKQLERLIRDQQDRITTLERLRDEGPP